MTFTGYDVVLLDRQLYIIASGRRKRQTHTQEGQRELVFVHCCSHLRRERWGGGGGEREREREGERERERERTNERTNEFFNNEGNGISTALFYIQPSGKNTNKQQQSKTQ